jgi:CPA2 family monovalent cation:H+ antiporter-2
MLIEPEVVRDNATAFVALVVVAIAVKGLITAALARAAGERVQDAVIAGGMMAQAGEFSFVLIGVGLEQNAVSDEIFSLVVAATAVSVVLAPPLVTASAWLSQRVGSEAAAPAADEPAAADTRLGRRAVVCGYGEAGRTVVTALRARFEVLVVDEDHRRLHQLNDEGVATVIGDPSNAAIIDRMRLEECRVLVVAMNDPFSKRLLIERVRARYPRLDVVAHASDEREATQLREAGADEAVVAEREAALELVRHSLHRFGVDARQAVAIVQRMRAERRS